MATAASVALPHVPQAVLFEPLGRPLHRAFGFPRLSPGPAPGFVARVQALAPRHSQGALFGGFVQMPQGFGSGARGSPFFAFGFGGGASRAPPLHPLLDSFSEPFPVRAPADGFVCT